MMNFELIFLVLLLGVILVVLKLRENKRHAEKVRLRATIYDQDNEKIGQETHKMSYNEYRKHIKKANKTKTDEKGK